MNEQKRAPVNYTFKDRETGAPLATAIVPEGYNVGGILSARDGNELVPLRAYITAAAPDRSILLNATSKGMWDHLLNPIMIRTAKMMGTPQGSFSDFRDPERYLTDFATAFSDGRQVTPIARATLPGGFADNRQAILNDFINEVRTREGSGPNVQLEIVNAICEPLLMKFAGRREGRPAVILVGCEYMGAEYRNAITPAMMMGGGFGLLAALVGGAKKAKTAGQRFPFGHAREHGQAVDVIRWGFNRLYLCVCDASVEREATEIFMRFLLSYTPDMNFIQRREQMAFQNWQRAMQTANQLAGVARQQQMMAQQRAMETSRMIAQNSAQISAGIMDSWNRRMASDSRISQNWSEAVRGVNTYRTTDGRRVEVGVTADHVYQNNYGDVYGVSGVAPDQDILNRLNWTELNR